MFFTITDGKYPFVQGDGPVESRQKFAQCPGCNNPILMVGIGVANTKRAAHGKHYHERVSGFPFFDKETRKTCPYRLKKAPSGGMTARRKGVR